MCDLWGEKRKEKELTGNLNYGVNSVIFWGVLKKKKNCTAHNCTPVSSIQTLFVLQVCPCQRPLSGNRHKNSVNRTACHDKRALISSVSRPWTRKRTKQLISAPSETRIQWSAKAAFFFFLSFLLGLYLQISSCFNVW